MQPYKRNETEIQFKETFTLRTEVSVNIYSSGLYRILQEDEIINTALVHMTLSLFGFVLCTKAKISGYNHLNSKGNK